ncbi:MAG: hypothetical protein ACI4B3_01095 [Prevotella sp.]
MDVIIILLLILAIGGIIIGGLQFFFSSKNDGVVVEKPTCATCSGDDSRCEQECMMEAATKPIEYYDDEELDRFAGRPSDSYTDEEAEEFREVLYTMKPEEVKGWNRSLILRHVNMPDQLKDEVVILLEER